MKKRILVIALCIALSIMLVGCGKENKYVNMGVDMSTDGINLMLTGYTHSLQTVSNYVFFTSDIDATLDKLNRDTQGIVISYVRVSDLGKIKKDMDLKVVFADCFETDGALKGVWVAKESWLENAPNYSKKFIKNLCKCVDYRASHMSMTYEEALDSIKGLKEFDFDKQSDVMQFCAIYASNNNETLTNNAFSVCTISELYDMFYGFSGKSGEGYELCKDAYDKFCSGADCKSFEELFDFSAMNKSLDELINAGE